MVSFATWGNCSTVAMIPGPAIIICPHCHNYVAKKGHLIALASYVVGWTGAYTTDNPSADIYHKGKIVIECPHCARKYWFHLSVALAFQMANKCPRWPAE